MSINLRILLLAGSVLFLIWTVWSIRKRKLDLYHSIRWFVGAVVIFIMALFPDVMEKFSRLVGIEVPSNLVFLIMIVYLLLTCLALSGSVSRQHARIRELIQRTALLENRILELEKKQEDSTGSISEKKQEDSAGSISEEKPEDSKDAVS